MGLDGGFARILVATDFSEGSEKAWRVAQRLATALGAELVLLHVLPASPVDEDQQALVHIQEAEHQLGIPRAAAAEDTRRAFDGPLSGDRISDFSTAGRAWAQRLEGWAAPARAHGCDVRTLLRVGLPHREVVAAATEERADLVLLATHGHGEIQRLLVGSVADRVVRQAPCPVITVKEH